MKYFRNDGLLLSLLILLGLSVLSIGLLYLFSNRLYNSINADHFKLRELAAHQQNIIYYDEVLTMSANMGVQTGDASWKDRYDTFISKLDYSIKHLMSEVSEDERRNIMQTTYLSNQKLEQMERQAFALVAENRRLEAISSLNSLDYRQEKIKYNSGMTEFESNLEKRKKQIIEDLDVKKSRMNALFLFIGILVTSLGGTVIYIVNKYSRKLTSLNLELEQKVHQRSLELERERERSFRVSKLITVGEVSASIAHDIANPLSIIIARAEIALEEINSPEAEVDKKKLAEVFNIILKMSQRILRIVRNIQYLSQSGSEDELEPINVYELCKNSLDIVEEKAKSIEVELEILVDPGLSFYGRRTQLVQLLVNLLNNAIDACEKSNKKQVCVKAFMISEKAIAIQVIDSGEGIPLELRDKILEPLYSTKKNGKGTGLGLTIVQRIIENHRGQLSIRSTEAGTEFCVSLPIASP